MDGPEPPHPDISAPDDDWSDIFGEGYPDGGDEEGPAGKPGEDPAERRARRLNALLQYNQLLKRDIDRKRSGISGAGNRPATGTGIAAGTAPGATGGHHMQSGMDPSALISELQQVRQRIIDEKSAGKDVSLAEENFRKAQPAYQAGDMAMVMTILSQVKDVLDGTPAQQQSPAQPTQQDAIAELTRAKQALMQAKQSGAPTQNAEAIFTGAQPQLQAGDFAGAIATASRVLEALSTPARAPQTAQEDPASGPDPAAAMMEELQKVRGELMEAQGRGVDVTRAQEVFRSAQAPLQSGDHARVQAIIDEIRGILAPQGQGAPSEPEDQPTEAPATAPTMDDVMPRLQAVRERIFRLKSSGVRVDELETRFRSAEPLLRSGQLAQVMETLDAVMASADAQDAPRQQPLQPESPPAAPPEQTPAPEQAPPAPPEQTPAPEQTQQQQPPQPESPPPTPPEQTPTPQPTAPQMSPGEVEARAKARFLDAQKRLMAMKGAGEDTSGAQEWLKSAGAHFARKEFGALLDMEPF